MLQQMTDKRTKFCKKGIKNKLPPLEILLHHGSTTYKFCDFEKVACNA